MTNKKIIGLVFTAFTSVSTVIALTSKGSGFLSYGIGNAGEWVHYEGREATASLNGIREYWVQCGGTYRFTAPQGVTIREGGSNWDLSEFTDNDPRYIKWIDDSKMLYYSLNDSQTINTELLVELNGFTLPTEHEETLGSSKRIYLEYDGSHPAYSVSIMTVTDVITNESEFNTLLCGYSYSGSAYSSKNVEGYYVIGNDIATITTPKTYTNNPTGNPSEFKAILDGRNHTIGSVTISNESKYSGLFGVRHYKDGLIKNLNISSFTSINSNGGLFGYAVDGLKLENVSITASQTYQSLLGGLLTNVAGTTFTNCVFDFNGKNNVNLFNSKENGVNALVAYVNCLIKNKKGVANQCAIGNTESYDEEGLRWSYNPNTVSLSDTVYYDLSTGSVDTSNATYDLTGYSYYASVDKSAIEWGDEAGTTQTIYAIRDEYTTYKIEALLVTRVIKTGSDITAMCSDQDSGKTDGYYVVGADISNYTCNGRSTNSTAFSGTFDGAGHTIDGFLTWGNGLFGLGLNGATFKNVNFTNLRGGYILGYYVKESLIENCTFTMGNRHTYSNKAMLAGLFTNLAKLKDIYFDFAEYTDMYVATNNDIGSATCYVTYENVRMNRLIGTNFYNTVTGTDPEGINPTAVIYTGMPIISDGGTLYTIKYVNTVAGAQAAANKISDRIYAATSVRIPVNSISDSTVVSNDTKAIVVGSSNSCDALSITLPSGYTASTYRVSTNNRSIYLLAGGSDGYALAANRFLELSIGYDYLGKGATYTNSEMVIYSKVSGTNPHIELPIVDVTVNPYTVRRCDWTDPQCNGTEMGYNYSLPTIAYHDTVTDTYENYHTSMHVLNPTTYESKHSKWYAKYTDLSGVYKYSNNTDMTYGQLCFTARGSSSEYNSMVSTAANNIIDCFANNSNPDYNTFCFGINDNSGYCHCSTCNSKTSEYGSITGTVIKFVNDINTIIQSRISETKRSAVYLCLFAYKEYINAPVSGSAGNYTANIHCDNNVSVLYAPIRANYTKSMADSSNSTYAELFDKWSYVSDSVDTWMYQTNFQNYLYPLNSFKANTETLTYLQDKNIRVAYFQGQHGLYQPKTGFYSLKLYLNGKFMADPNSDYDTLVNRFFSGYYGEGGTKMRTFFDQMIARLEYMENNQSSLLYDSSGYHNSSINQKISTSGVWNQAELESWVTLCNEAYALATTNEAKMNVLTESIFPRFALCTLFADQYSGTELTSMRTSFKQDADTLGITTWRESNAQESVEVTSNLLSAYYSYWGIA